MTKRRQPPAHVSAQPTSLTPRECDVLALVALGKRNKAIADALEISENTVETHLKVIFKKLQVHTRVEAALACAQQAK